MLVRSYRLAQCSALALSMLVMVSGCSRAKGATADRQGATGAENGQDDDTDGRTSTGVGVDSTDAGEKPSTKKKPAKVTTASDDDADAKDADCYKGSNDICAIEEKIFELVNKERKNAGLSALAFSPRVSFVAREWSSEQASERRISHDGWPQARESEFYDEFGTPLGTDAENVAMIGGSSATAVAQQLMQMWMGSPGHRANILGAHRGLGVGLAERGDGEWYATQLFTTGVP